MNLKKIYNEEDLFPKEITCWEEREYGLLFYNEDNKDSYDSNHAIIFKNKVTDLEQVLDDIVRFYTEKGIRPNIYQSINDDVCRVNYLLVSKECRNRGVGRALISSLVEYCKVNQTDNCFLWTDGETAEKIYYEAGFRYIETKQAGRATYANYVRLNLWR